MMRMRIFILFAAAHIFAAAPFSAGALTTETATAAEHQGPNIIAEEWLTTEAPVPFPASWPHPVIDSPIIITGSAGSGTRVVANVLHALGVLMPPPFNGQRDDLGFINMVKQQPFFGDPTLHDAKLNGTTLIDTMHRTDYTLDEAAAFAFHQPLLNAILAFKEDMKARLHKTRAAQTSAQALPVRWMFKEPQALFVLPYLRHVFPGLTVVHVVRDGRDVLLSKQQHRPYQQYYQRAFCANCDEQTGIARLWEEANMQSIHHMQRWRIPYLSLRLEDLCATQQNPNLAASIGHFLYDTIGPERIARAVDTIVRSKCRVRKYQSVSAAESATLESLTSRGLAYFGYGAMAILANFARLYQEATVTFAYGSGQETLLLNFWAAYRSVSQKPLLVITDQLSLAADYVNEAQITVLYDGARPLEERFWLTRFRWITDLVRKNVTVIVTDLDALWHRDVWAKMQSKTTQDVVFSSGRHPAEIAAQWGRTGPFFFACMGLFYVRATTETSTLLTKGLDAMQVNELDDQSTMNQVLYEHYRQCTPLHDRLECIAIANATEAAYPTRIALLDDALIRRRCHFDDHQHGSALSTRLVASHCLIPKREVQKREGLREYGLWSLS